MLAVIKEIAARGETAETVEQMFNDLHTELAEFVDKVEDGGA